MPEVLRLILSATILIPAILGCIRARRIDVTFWPFVACMVLASVFEISSNFLLSSERLVILFYNYYSLLEAILLSSLFILWQNPGRRWLHTTLIMAALLIVFAVTTQEALRPYFAESIFMVAYSCLLVVLSTNEINRQIINSYASLFKNAKFLIAVGILIYHTFIVLVEGFWWYSTQIDSPLIASLYPIILMVINPLINFLFAYAIVCIPAQPKFLLQS